MYSAIFKPQLAGFVCALTCAFASLPTAAAKPAPIYGLDHPLRIPDQYVVVLKPQAQAQNKAALNALKQELDDKGFVVEHQFKRALDGFKINIGKSSGAKLAANSNSLDALSRNPHVAFIEADRWVYADQINTNVRTQSPVVWGLDRIDQEHLPLSNSYSYSRTGAGVNVYVIDSGIRADHQEFTGRVAGGVSFANNPSALDDCTGHGTHVAGTIGGNMFGVAKEVTLWSVRVFDCSNTTSWSQILAGLEWVIANHQRPAIINMSLGGSRFNSINLAVDNAVSAGISVVVAAGNSNEDACNTSPASANSALTVGASTLTDSRADFSNWGSCVDLFAPGQYISSSWHTSTTAINSQSGTSMAAPHVAGAVALYLQQQPQATPAQVAQALVDNANKSKLLNTGSGSPNLLLSSNITGFSANFEQLMFRGDANNWAATPMTLVADNTWEIQITQASGTSMQFKFDLLGDWYQNYGDNEGDGQAEPYGNNIKLPCGGNHRIRFDDRNLRYSIETTPACSEADWKRTVIFIEGITQTNQNLFIRGGIDHAYAAQQGIHCTVENQRCAIPIRHLNLRNATTAPWKQGDDFLDWYGAEVAQSSSAQGSPLDWTTNLWPTDWGAARYVGSDGYGLSPLNLWGSHYWMLDVEMDCSRTRNGWFEFKSFISNGAGWEGNINQPGAPYTSSNHFAQCGRISSFRRNQDNPVWVGDF
uniref:S8 family serine peptidase n=1 Tax=Cellvibrio fontiphilus TaxID=1815559 RepID=UPI002B4C2163|nr:S8 family serine peptidase [Cellvibrio fontiphilus]